MEITRDTLKKYGKLAGIGVVGAGIGGAGVQSFADQGPTDELQNLEDQVDELETENSELEDEVDSLSERPTEAEYNELQNLEDQVDELETENAELTDEVNELSDRPTEAEYTELQNQVAEMFSQEQVNEMLAREDVLEFLPVIADEEVEVEYLHSEEVDGVTGTDSIHVADTDSSFNGGTPSNYTQVNYDTQGEEFDEVRAVYEHEDGHVYYATAVEFEDSEDAEEFEAEAQDMVNDEDYEDVVGEDAAVIREGDTVVYVYGNADTNDYGSYDFEAFTGQY